MEDYPWDGDAVYLANFKDVCGSCCLAPAPLEKSYAGNLFTSCVYSYLAVNQLERFTICSENGTQRPMNLSRRYILIILKQQ